MLKNVCLLLVSFLVMSLQTSAQDITDGRYYFSFINEVNYTETASLVTSEQEFYYDINCGCPVVAMFTASWCGPCKMIFPYFCSLPSSYPSVAFIYVDVDQLKEVAKDQGIKNLPTFMMYKDSQVLDTVIGANRQALVSMIQSHIN